VRFPCSVRRRLRRGAPWIPPIPHRARVALGAESALLVTPETQRPGRLAWRCWRPDDATARSTVSPPKANRATRAGDPRCSELSSGARRSTSIGLAAGGRTGRRYGKPDRVGRASSWSGAERTWFVGEAGCRSVDCGVGFRLVRGRFRRHGRRSRRLCGLASFGVRRGGRGRRVGRRVVDPRLPYFPRVTRWSSDLVRATRSRSTCGCQSAAPCKGMPASDRKVALRTVCPCTPASDPPPHPFALSIAQSPTVQSWRVYPSNHASSWCSVVPACRVDVNAVTAARARAIGALSGADGRHLSTRQPPRERASSGGFPQPGSLVLVPARKDHLRDATLRRRVPIAANVA